MPCIYMGAALILGKDILRARAQSRVMRGIVLRGARNRKRFFSLKLTEKLSITRMITSTNTKKTWFHQK